MDDMAAVRRALEIQRAGGTSDSNARVEKLLSRWDQEQADIFRRLDRLTSNQREMEARLWAIENSRVFRILQYIGIVSGQVKQKLRQVTNPRAESLEKQRLYQLWLETQTPKAINLNDLPYQPRFRVITVGNESAAALNHRVGDAGGDYFIFLSPACSLTSNTLGDLAVALQKDQYEVLYGDEDHLTDSGARRDPVFKPSWSPDLTLSPSYLGRLLVVSDTAFRSVGGFQEAAQGAHIFDLSLRLSERPVRFHHVARILASEEGPADNPEPARLALERAIERRGIAAAVEHSKNGLIVRRKVRGRPLASIIICSRRAKWLKRCLDAIECRTAYTQREIIVVEHVAEDNRLDRVLSGYRCNRVRYSGRFDFAAMNNLAAKAAQGDVLVFLNDDVQPLSDSWLEDMLGQAQRPEVGVVGALLRYPSGAIQHAGIALGLMGSAGHPGRGTLDGAFWPWTRVTRNVSAVTGACMAIRRDVFWELHGFDPLFPVNYNDVDFCLRARRAGYEVILEASTEMRHIESGTRPRGVTWEERELFASRWGALIAESDPYYSPNLTVSGEGCGLAGR